MKQREQPEDPTIEEKLTDIRAVILDMDGLMIDSEPLHVKAYDQVLKQFGQGLTEEENSQRYVGISDRDIARDMVKRYGLPTSEEELIKRKREKDKQLLREEVVAQPGLIELLSSLKTSGLKTAIASSASLEEIETVMSALDIKPMIDTYCSADQVSKGKPEPDLFMLAATKLGILPKCCLVLEDAPSGIEAAAKAGMKSVAVPSRETIGQNFDNATLRLNNLTELVGRLKFLKQKTV